MNLLLEQKVRERTAQLEEVNQRLSAEHGELARAVAALRDAQGQLIQAEKMATVGLFTAGIAHEINNPLGFLLPDFEELERWVSVYRGGGDPSVVMSGADLDQLLRDCRDGLRRIAHIVKQISVFSHQTSQDAGRVEVAVVAAGGCSPAGQGGPAHRCPADRQPGRRPGGEGQRRSAAAGACST